MISIIIPVYNTEKYLPDCLNSVISQTYQDFEVILVDDGSQDKSGFICNHFAEKDTRIKVIHQKNEGVSKARYNGVLASKGEWAFFVDSDDYLPSDALDSLFRQSEGFDIISGALEILNDEKKATPLPKRIKETGIFTKEELINGMLLGTRIPNIVRMLISMSLLKKQLILIDRNVRIFEDFLLSLSIYLGVSRAKGIAQTVYYYRMNESSTVHTHKQTIKDAEIVDEYIESILKDNIVFRHAVFKHRIIELKRFIDDSNIIHSRLYLKAQEQAPFCKKSKGDTIVLTLCKIRNVATRQFFWSLFTYLSRFKMR